MINKILLYLYVEKAQYFSIYNTNTFNMLLSI